MKKFIKTLTVLLALVISFSLLLVGPLYNLKVIERTQEVSVEEVESEPTDAEEPEVDTEQPESTDTEQPESEEPESTDTEQSESTDTEQSEVDTEQSEIDNTLVVEKIAIGDFILEVLNIYTDETSLYYLQTISSWVSGVIYGFTICYLIRGIRKKSKKNIKKYNKNNGNFNSLKTSFPIPAEQNQHKKNNISF